MEGLSQYIMENKIHVWNHKPDDDDEDEDVGAHVLGETNPNHQPVMQKNMAKCVDPPVGPLDPSPLPHSRDRLS